VRLPDQTWKRDVLVAAVVTTAAEVELFLTRDAVSGTFSMWVLTTLLVFPALALRRTRPLAAVGVAAVTFGISSVIGEAPVAVPFLALLLLVASTGWHASLARGLVAVATLIVVGLLPSVVGADTAAADVVVNAAIVLGAWAAGHGLRRASDRRVLAELTADRAARDAVAAERVRISRDLHDSMAHALTLITLQAGSARERSGDEDTSRLLGAIETTGRGALADMHRFLDVVGRSDSEAPGLAHLDALVDGVERNGLAVHLDVDLPEEIPGSIATTVYRVVQEGLTNAIRHSGATRATVGITGDHRQVVVRVLDNGQGRTPPVAGAGQGLAGLRERVGLFGGGLEFGPCATGWTLEAHIPLGYG
jgi:signal transduction histidine kinase